MTARHVRPKGQPRRSWAPLDPDAPRTLPELVPDPQPLSDVEVQALRDQFGDDLWAVTMQKLGDDQALKQLAPRLGRRDRTAVPR
jgi:hypothetical protein